MLHIYIDEAGRGPLAGPVYVGLIALDQSSKLQAASGKKRENKRIGIDKSFRDSKKLSEKQRELLFTQLEKSDIVWSYGKSTAKYIDKHGIVGAIRHAIVHGVKKIVSITDWSQITLHIDGNTDFGLRKKFPGLTVCTYIKGDDRIPVISAASIIAKVLRDREMIRLDKKYAVYGFAQHKGYGTQLHRNMISTHGLSPLHRKSFCKI